MKLFDRIVYLTINKINGKKYVGQDCYNRPGYLGSGKALKMAIKKYGFKNFEKQILCKCNSQSETDLMEKYWIKTLNTIEDGYNILPGGKGNGYKEYIVNMSVSLSGEKNPMYGKSLKDVLIDKYGYEIGTKKWDDANNKRSINGKNKGTKPVIQLDKDGNIINEYDSMSQASEITGANINGIRSVCNGNAKTAGKFYWMWKIKNNN